MARGESACDTAGVPLPRLLRSASAGAEGLLDRALCVVGAVLFSQAPEFMQQYLQRLEGHLDEARLAVDRFKQVAAQSGMTLDQLASAASENTNAAVGKLGSVVGESLARADALAASDAALRAASPLERPFVFLAHLDWGIARSTFSIYRPAVPTTMEGAVYSGIGIVAILCLYHLAVKGPIVRRMRRSAPARPFTTV
jgi:Protein of unknown function (DUF2937)